MERDPSAAVVPDRGRPHIGCPACRAAVPLMSGSGPVGRKLFRCPRCGAEFALEPEDHDR